ncbi:hypothetical protein Pan241w_26110 [Gimesia alba]|uniref:Radical SAM core domain-containing protein n=1 Tax=Gimesia alba TaxID=2527973 RepID=A0A517RF76_9PLAN|nr:radical SAM protein [Gimesia alba]QDT42526.1 hypothetical protein Pan241w_26110 [Gimesia alba]
MKHSPQFGIGASVLQPTTFCNLDCSYCYLTEKHKKILMKPDIPQRLSDFIQRNITSEEFKIIWHASEPLAMPLDQFKKLHKPLACEKFNIRVRHNIQTNATLLNSSWCEFLKNENFEIGVSVDGPLELNRKRKYRSGKESFNSTMRGIDLLKHFEIPFATISVIGNDSLKHAAKIYHFVKGIGSRCMCINVEEKEGANKGNLTPSVRVENFWKELVEIWMSDDKPIKVREIQNNLEAMSSMLAGDSANGVTIGKKIDLFPSIAVNGDVVLLSPELLNAERKNTTNEFIVGNLLSSDLSDILAVGMNSRYVKEYLEGIQKCSRGCDYFQVCGGGQASNKYFENGNLNTSETAYCKNHKQTVIEAILDSIVTKNE